MALKHYLHFLMVEDHHLQQQKEQASKFFLEHLRYHYLLMVFFMIMPLLFGAFANFLIPTQLGVHDVAFPRLNSAAF